MSCSEIVEIGLDVRPLGHREAHFAEDRHHFVDGLADRMDPPVGLRANGKRNVGAVFREARFKGRRLEFRLFFLDRLGNGVLDLVERLAGRPPFLRRQLADAFHHFGDGAGTAEGPDPNILESLEVRPGNLPQQVFPQLIKIVHSSRFARLAAAAPNFVFRKNRDQPALSRAAFA